MIEVFFVWLLGPNLATVAVFALCIIIGLAPFCCLAFRDEHDRWPWEQKK